MLIQHVLPMFNHDIAMRVEQLLARVEGVKRGSDIGRPTWFDDAGQQHANRVAQRDAAKTAERLQTSVSNLNSVAE